MGRISREIVYTRVATRALSRMPADLERLIRDKLRLYAADPDALANNVKALKGEGQRYRLRIGDWRAVFTVEADQVIIHDVGPRGSIYG
jgi:mRNA interferase RelE/StbE